MVDLEAFRGLRYTDVDHLREVTAPPYDAIDPALADELRRRHPHNVVRLERAEATRDGDAYQQAARTYREWIEQGILRREEQPCLYVYEQAYVDDGSPRRQRGVFAALRLVPWDEGAVLPHEEIHRPAVEDRLRLLQALPANTSPVFALAEAEPAMVTQAVDEVVRDPALAAFRVDGVDHRFWPIARRDLQEAVVGGYRGVSLLMADGHHRYTTALEHREHGPPRPGRDRILAYVVGGDGPVIRPSHRVIATLDVDPESRLRAAGLALHPVEDAGGSLRDTVAEALAALERHDGPAFILVTDRVILVSQGDPTVELPRHVADLDVALAHTAASGPLGVSPGQAEITSDAREAVGAVIDGRARAALLVRAVPIARVRDTASRGSRMPPKSTAFHPKPRTGLVLRPLGD